MNKSILFIYAFFFFGSYLGWQSFLSIHSFYHALSIWFGASLFSVARFLLQFSCSQQISNYILFILSIFSVFCPISECLLLRKFYWGLLLSSQIIGEALQKKQYDHLNSKTINLNSWIWVKSKGWTISWSFFFHCIVYLLSKKFPKSFHYFLTLKSLTPQVSTFRALFSEFLQPSGLPHPPSIPIHLWSTLKKETFPRTECT